VRVIRSDSDPRQRHEEPGTRPGSRFQVSSRRLRRTAATGTHSNEASAEQRKGRGLGNHLGLVTQIGRRVASFVNDDEQIL
jgi:hypothetical protein